ATADTAATSLDVSYTDSGLIGFTISGKASDVKPVAQKGIEALKSAASGQISAEALSRAKKAAIVAADSKFYGNADQTINEVAKQVLASGKYQTSAEIATAISGVTADDVAKVAKLAVSSKPSVVAYGNLQLLPYADEL
ncbi:Cytochrome b-c1 complex subunit 2, mitochondrial, partial [Cladochytrium tenue]